MYLTGKEIKQLAEYAGFDVKCEDNGYLEHEYSIDDCPSLGVQDDDGSIHHYNYVVTCDGCDGNECTPLGDPIK